MTFLAGDALTGRWVSEFEEVRAEWDLLAKQSGSIFATFEWHQLWWRRFGVGKPLLLLLQEANGTPVAVVPLYRQHVATVDVLRFTGHGPADEGGPVCAPGSGSAVWPALLSALRFVPSDLLLTERLRPDAASGMPPTAREIGAESSPTIHISGSWEDYLAGLGRRMRHEIRHDERKVRADHRVNFRLSTDPERLADDLDVLFALHRLRWGHSQFAGLRAFHQEFARYAQSRGWLRLWFLELDDRPVAAWYGFRYGRADHHYQVGRDPSVREHSVGLLLTAHAIRAAVEDGMDQYRFLRGGEQYKFRFAADDAEVVTAAIGRSYLGRAMLRTGATLMRAGFIRALLRRMMAGPREAS